MFTEQTIINAPGFIEAGRPQWRGTLADAERYDNERMWRVLFDHGVVTDENDDEDMEIVDWLNTLTESDALAVLKAMFDDPNVSIIEAGEVQ